jgi:5-formyltetrahydrofolate cyclo-ligase
MTESKEALRCSAKQAPPVDSQAICDQILDHPWFEAATCIMAYVAIPPEPVLTQVLEKTLQRGKSLLLPRCEEDGTMTARKIKSLGQLRPGAFGILEPSLVSEIVPASEIDLILVPGLAFDPQGHRLGRGKGYYDRFLTGVRGKIMGICSDLVPEVPTEPHDCRMDAVVTEETIIFCEMEDDSCGMTSGI